MTAEQLEELQRLINRSKDFADQAKGHDAPLCEAELRKMADAMDRLARCVIAAEKLRVAFEIMEKHGSLGNFQKEALTAYREASK